MKFGRKSQTKTDTTPTDATTSDVDTGSDATETAEAETQSGPFDLSDVDIENDGVERVDLGSLLIAPAEGLELRLQVDEASREVQSVLIAGPNGAVEVKAFAAQRNGDLWSDVRRQIASETARQGGTATEVEGDHGTELVCQRTVRTAEGTTGQQPSRIVGFNGPRWFLRATYLGRPAVAPDEAGPWEEAVASMVIRRGDGPMAPGEQLPLSLPPQARRVD
ncbi:DUF3710 domain-containing protein [Nocardioides sp. JQ2195]|uniref:DUF3710 domain-containing protein n=1 Tax=Nocardioides sp. JQ2195 TaxID=2592334 RepID=UPI00143E9D85|nr:DUF3710 domain-containing protein [Nocardioides sp. JQ2195]QIX26462.1 DUF3710 domain-containing protein [Nocardioides sp. JQ2195]